MLGTQPYLRFGMIALEQRHLFFREREEAFERQIARITALDTPMVDRRRRLKIFSRKRSSVASPRSDSKSGPLS